MKIQQNPKTPTPKDGKGTGAPFQTRPPAPESVTVADGPDTAAPFQTAANGKKKK